MTGPPRGAGQSVMGALPLYFNIFTVLQREILGGAYPPARPLPSEDKLAKRFNVSRVTIRHAMSLLEKEKLILRQRGKGTFAINTQPPQPKVNSFDGLSQNIADFEANTQIDLLDMGPAPLPAWAREHARSNGADPDASIHRIIRVRRDARGPFSYSVCCVAGPAAARVHFDQMGNRTVIALLEDAGIIADRVEQRLTAVAADPEIARYLQVMVGAPLILMRRIMLDKGGDAFEYLEAYYRPDSFEYSVNLTREGGTASVPKWVSRRL